MNVLYISDSLAFPSKKGVFAKNKFEEGELVCCIEGKIRNCVNDIEDINSMLIDIGDDKILECNADSIVNKINDLVILGKEVRGFFESMVKDESFFKKHPDYDFNVKIYVNDENNRAYIYASKHIKNNEELFMHKGFKYWLDLESETNGFKKELDFQSNEHKYDKDSDIIKDCLLFFKKKYQKLDCPGFKRYIYAYYPNAIMYKAYCYETKNCILVDIILNDGTTTSCHINLNLKINKCY